jgi:DNA-binding transcriptional LysR family regulator
MSYGTFRLGPAIAEFMEKYPDVKIQLVLSHELVDPVQDGFDVTLRIAELESSSLIARKITPIDRAVCASPDYLARRGIPAHPRDLRDHVLLTYGFLLTGNQWKLTGADGDHWILPSWSLCVNSAEVLRDAAIRGRGVALMPTSSRATRLRKILCARCFSIIVPRPRRSTRSIRRPDVSRSRYVYSSIFWSSVSVKKQPSPGQQFTLVE